MKKCPCHHCEKRTPTCHSKCKEYKDFCDENEKTKQMIRDAKAPGIEYNASRKNSSFHKFGR